MSRQQSLPILTGPNILHNHSINSWLEQQNNRGLPSPAEGDTMSSYDIFGISNSSMFNQPLQSSPPGFPYSPITPNSLNLSPPADSGNSTSRYFDGFQFDCSNQSTPMKDFQRNFNSDLLPPLSSKMPTSSNQRSMREPFQFSNTNSPVALDNSPFNFANGMSSTSNSPDSGHSTLSSSVDNSLANLMNYLCLNQQQNQNQHVLGSISNEMKNVQTFQNLQTFNTLKLLQSQDYSRRNPLSQLFGFNQLLQGSQGNQEMLQQQQQEQQQQQQQHTSQPWSMNANNENNMNRLARNHHMFKWKGILPQKSSHSEFVNYSNKVFLGGVPLDAKEQMLVDLFSQFGPITVEWPVKDRRGYAYTIFENENQVRALLSVCSVQEANSCNVRKYFFNIPGKYQKTHKIEVIPWIIADSHYVKSASQKLDPSKTVFVGALHGQLTAKGLATIMDDIFKGVIYAGIDTDKFQYPLGSGRVTFNNNESYFNAIATAFIEVQTAKFKRKVFQIDPYLEDSLCSGCSVQHGPYFCRSFHCYRYYCRECWRWTHMDPKYSDHKPMTRNSKSQHLIGFGTQQQSPNAAYLQQSSSFYYNLPLSMQ